jgi:DNA repair protein RadA/Sms
MAKSKTKFVCQNCGFENPKYMGKCPGCGQWNTLVEELEETDKNIVKISDNTPICINNLKSGQYERYDTGIMELNRVLGGGLVRGSLTLISGDPGIGKSTLLLKCAENISLKYGKVIYVSGEESGEQIKIRGDRLLCSSPNLYIMSETNLETIEKLVSEEQPTFVVIDSIQTMFSSNLSSAPGSVSQVRECANNLMKIGKSSNIPLFIVAHVTKQGDLAGPRVLEHMVDTVLSFEGERSEEYRILRTAKNRFGTTTKQLVYQRNMDFNTMTEIGYIDIPYDGYIKR